MFEVMTPPSKPLSILTHLATDIEVRLIYIEVISVAGTRTSFGVADLETLIFTCFRAKRGTLLSLESRAPILTFFNPNETWHRHLHMITLYRSHNGWLAQELVFGQQTSKH